MNSMGIRNSITENPMSDDDASYFHNYEIGLSKKSSHELEMELAQFHFDLLFIQTQIEASGPEYQNSLSAKNAAEKRVLRLQRKIESVKKELYHRSSAQ